MVHRRIYLSYSPAVRTGLALKKRQEGYESNGIEAEKVYDIIDGKKVILDRALEQAEGKGGFMLDLSIGKSIRMRKGQLSINLSLTNVLNNRKFNNSVNSITGEVGSTRNYKFDRNPYKFYSYGINGMLNLGYRF